MCLVRSSVQVLSIPLFVHLFTLLISVFYSFVDMLDLFSNVIYFPSTVSMTVTSKFWQVVYYLSYVYKYVENIQVFNRKIMFN